MEGVDVHLEGDSGAETEDLLALWGEEHAHPDGHAVEIWFWALGAGEDGPAGERDTGGCERGGLAGGEEGGDRGGEGGEDDLGGGDGGACAAAGGEWRVVAFGGVYADGELVRVVLSAVTLVGKGGVGGQWVRGREE